MDNKFYFYEKGETHFLDSVIQYKDLQKQHSNLQYIYLLDETELLHDNIMVKLHYVINELKSNDILEKNIIISFNHKNDDNTTKAYNKLVKMSIKFPKIKFGIEDGSTTWNLCEIYNSNAQVDKIVEEIQSKKLSPLEQLMYAYFEVTKRLYNDTQNNENKDIARTIFGVLNSDKIVCVGYCELFGEIISRLQQTQVKIFQNNVATEIINEKYSLHRNMIIYIKDEKYGIDGYYYCDPTWDATHKEEQEYRLNFFMLSLKDLANINEYIICKDKITYSGITYTNGSNKDIKYFNLPERDDKVSFYNNNASFNSEFVNFILKDKNYKTYFLSHIKDFSEREKYFFDNSSAIVNEIDSKSKKIDVNILHSCLQTVLQQKFEDMSKQDLIDKITEIFNTNKAMTKIAFENPQKANFNDTNCEQIM